MSKVKHTPGPWEHLPDLNDGSQFRIVDRTHLIAVAGDYRNIHDLERAEANAKLIAAAPDMLTFIQEVLVDLRNNETWADQVRDGKILLEIDVDATKAEEMLTLILSV